MKNWFRADLEYQTISEITPELLREKDIFFILVDLDNTLADYDTPVPTESVLSWLHSLQEAGIAVAIVSNNNRARVSKFCEALDIPHFWKSGKPRRRAVTRALEALSAKPEQTALIGDKKLTDVLCARRAGIFSIKVQSIKPRSFAQKFFSR